MLDDNKILFKVFFSALAPFPCDTIILISIQVKEESRRLLGTIGGENEEVLIADTIVADGISDGQ